MKEPAKYAAELFNSGYLCAESVLKAVAEKGGRDDKMIPRIATGFCAGLSRTSGMCGALAGAILGVNLFTGRDRPDQSYEDNFALTARLANLFESRFGSLNCTALLGCDLGTPYGKEKFKTDKLREKICTGLVEEATAMALMLIEEHQNTPKE